MMEMNAGDLVRVKHRRGTVQLVHPLPRSRTDDKCEVKVKGWCVLDEGKHRFYRVEDLRA